MIDGPGEHFQFFVVRIPSTPDASDNPKMRASDIMSHADCTIPKRSLYGKLKESVVACAKRSR